jgi:hypothetical protein
MNRPALPTQEELQSLDDAELEQLAVEWRARASRGERDAYGVAHALEVELRQRVRASNLQQLPPEAPVPPRPWWKFWQGPADGSNTPT